MRITFDTNVLDGVARPSRFPSNPALADMTRVHEALKSRAIEGVFCATVITIEGMRRVDRAPALDSTHIETHRTEEGIDEQGYLVVNLDMRVKQPARVPLNAAASDRIRAALDLGLKLLNAPRIGLPSVDDQSLFLEDADLATRLDRYHAISQEIDARGLGFSVIKALGDSFLAREGLPHPWFKGLALARDVHEQNAVARAFAEWADGDTVAAHFGYGIDLLCTEDAGASAGAPSIFGPSERQWLQDRFGIEFVSLAELTTRL